jgi:hypothetical protein
LRYVSWFDDSQNEGQSSKRLMLQSTDWTRDQCGAMDTCSSWLLHWVVNNRRTTAGSCPSSTQR